MQHKILSFPSQNCQKQPLDTSPEKQKNLNKIGNFNHKYPSKLSPVNMQNDDMQLCEVDSGVSQNVGQCSKGDIWRRQQLECLCYLYQENGPCWSIICSKLATKSQSRIKNKFNNGVKALSNRLRHIEDEHYKNTKKSMKKQLIFSLLDFIHQLQESSKLYNLTLNDHNMYVKVRTLILLYSLKLKQYETLQLLSLLKEIKYLNGKIKCFGIYKKRNRKSFRLSKQALRKIHNQERIFLNFQEDDIELEGEQSMECHGEIKRLEQVTNNFITGSPQLEDNNIDDFPSLLNYNDQLFISQQNPFYQQQIPFNNAPSKKSQTVSIVRCSTNKQFDEEIDLILGICLQSSQNISEGNFNTFQE